MFFRLEKRIAAAILFSFPYSASALQTAAYLCCPPGCLTALHQRCNQLEQCTDQLLIQWQLLIIFHRYFLTILQCSLEIGLNILYDTTVIKIAATFKMVIKASVIQIDRTNRSTAPIHGEYLGMDKTGRIHRGRI